MGERVVGLCSLWFGWMIGWIRWTRVSGRVMVLLIRKIHANDERIRGRR